MAIYEKYYHDAKEKAQMLITDNMPSLYCVLLDLYYDAKVMTRKDIFNKYKLNEKIYFYATEQNDALWKIICATFGKETSEEDIKTMRIIIDGSFEKLCDARLNPDAVIERLVHLL